MPELPEVETIKRNLEPDVVGKIISGIQILSPKNFFGNKNDVIGSKITEIRRYGKVLVFKLANPLTRNQTNIFLNVHFKLSGQMLFAKNVTRAVYKNKIPFTKGNVLPANTTRVIIKFKNGSGLFFNDLRKFGWIKITGKPLMPKGVDVLSKKFTPQLIESLTRKTKKPIKTLLMDQDLITGIGNIYANDSLFLAKIHPLKPASNLTAKEIYALHKAIVKEINSGINHRGSSGADEAFILPDGSRGGHQRHFLVYQREDEPCLNCTTKIKRIKHHGRSSFYCPNCQK